MSWTIMLYLAGDNNLSEEMLWSIKEAQAAQLGANTVAVQFDPLGGGIPVQRYVMRAANIQPDDSVFEKGITIAQAEQQIPAEQTYRHQIENTQEQWAESFTSQPNFENAGDPSTLLHFIHWAHRQGQQDDNLMLVLSGHGCGFEDDFLLRDESPGASLTIRELARTLDAARQLVGREISILGMDSCLMSTAEVYYELNECIQYLVASEGNSLNRGWPYRSILGNLPDSAEDVAIGTVEKYLTYYFEYAAAAQSVDISASRTARCGLLRDAVREFAAQLESALDIVELRNAIILAHWAAQSYKSDQYVDLVDFADVLQEGLKHVHFVGEGEAVGMADLDAMRICRERLGQQCQQIHNVIVGIGQNPEDGVVRRAGYSGPAFQYSHGLSVYFPWSRVSENYGQLRFAQRTGWGEFLNRYVEATRRDPRHGVGARGNAFLERILNPDPAMIGRVRPSTPDWLRVRKTPPDDRGMFQIENMKNPPIRWLRQPPLDDL